jgi:Family of unknown function (DUF5715)
LMFVLCVVASTNLFALHSSTPVKRQKATRRQVRRVYWNPVLKGSHESMIRQNAVINDLQLPRIANEEELLSLEVREELVPVSDSRALRLAPHLDVTRRYCRRWTRQFLEDISEAYYHQFNKPLWVTSLVRTVEQQHRLRRHNGNAAPADGEITSSHLAGISVDFGKSPMLPRERRWFDQYVLELQQQGLVEAAEERRQACYHIMVSDKYEEWAASRKLAAASAQGTH